MRLKSDFHQHTCRHHIPFNLNQVANHAQPDLLLELDLDNNLGHAGTGCRVRDDRVAVYLATVVELVPGVFCVLAMRTQLRGVPA